MATSQQIYGFSVLMPGGALSHSPQKQTCIFRSRDPLVHPYPTLPHLISQLSTEQSPQSCIPRISHTPTGTTFLSGLRRIVVNQMEAVFSPNVSNPKTGPEVELYPPTVFLLSQPFSINEPWNLETS